MKKILCRFTLLLVAICLVWVGTLAAEEEGASLVTDLAGPEIWIDGPDSVRSRTDVRRSDVAVANDGTRIHVWTAFDPFDRTDIFLRRFDADGNPLEDPRQVNTTTEKDQLNPRVAVSADGSFLVIFQSSETPSGQGFDQFMVRSQAFNAMGNAVGPEQLVSTVPTSEQVTVHADVAALRAAGGSAGGYAVVWRNSTLVGSNWGDIKGSLVSTTGVPGAELLINSTNNGTERWCSVTEMSDGGFFVVWVEGDVKGRRFNSAGGPMGPDFKISSFNNTSPYGETDAAIGWEGTLLVVWNDLGIESPPLPPGSGGEIRGRVLDRNLNAQGNDFRINNISEGNQDDTRVADLGPQGFLVVWNSDTTSAGSDTIQSIEARVVSGPNAFDANGDGADDPQVQYNIWDNNAGQNVPGTHGSYGRVATSWQSNTWDGEPEPDAINQLFVIGRNLDACIFCDDFDWFSPSGTGNLWRWAMVVP